MTQEEYKAKMQEAQAQYEAALKALKDKFVKDKREIAKEYLLSNNDYKVGDVVKDLDNRIIRLTEISIGFSPLQKEYKCVYGGVQLNKDFTPKMPQKTVQATYIKMKLNS